jgi:hypothetical protein
MPDTNLQFSFSRYCIIFATKASLNRNLQLFVKTNNNLHALKILLWRGDGSVAGSLNSQEENLTQMKTEYLIAF